MKMKLDGASKKATAKAKKGSSPNQSHEKLRLGEDGRSGLRLFGAAVVSDMDSPRAPGRPKVRPHLSVGSHLCQHYFEKLRSCLNVSADDRIPIRGDQCLCRIKLRQSGEHRARHVWKFVQDVLRHHAARAQVSFADRMAVALHPFDLAFVRVQVFHP